MITFYAGILDENGECDRFLPVTMPKATFSYDSSGPEIERVKETIYDVPLKIKYHTRVKVAGSVNELSNVVEYENMDGNITSLKTLAAELLGVTWDGTDSDYNKLLNTEISFFTSNNVSNKLNFSMYFISAHYPSDREKYIYGVFIGDVTRTIGFSFVITLSVNDFYFVMNDIYNGDTFDELLESARISSENDFNYEYYEKLYNYPEFSPFSIFSMLSSTNDLYSIGYNSYSREYNICCVNLSRWSNWCLMITGEYFYGEPFYLKLREPIKGVDRIFLTTPNSPNVIDEGYVKNDYHMPNYPDVPVECVGISYYTLGTDLFYIFDVSYDDYYNDSLYKTIYLENGELTLTSDSSYFYFWFVLNGKGIKVACANKKNYLSVSGTNYLVTSHYEFLKSYVGVGVAAVDCRTIGCYLFVPYNYAVMSADKWINNISKDFSHIGYGNCPIIFSTSACDLTGHYNSDSRQCPFFFTNYFNEKYVNGEIPYGFAIPGIAINYFDVIKSSSGGFDNRYVGLVNPVSNLPIDYGFWNELLTGAFPKKPPNTGGGSIGGGTSSSGGGKGAFNDSGVSIPTSSIPLVNATTLGSTFKMFSMSPTAVANLSSFLNNSSNWQSIESGTNALFEGQESRSAVLNGIISLKQMYTPGSNISWSENDEIVISGVPTDVRGNVIDKQYMKFNLGSYVFKEYFGRFLDYEPYTKIKLYLPFSGVYDISPSDVMNGTITLSCIVDFLSGNISYELLVFKNNQSSVLYNWDGNCSYEIPLTSNDYNGKIMSMTAGAVSAAIGLGSIIAAPVTGGLSIAGGAAVIGGGASIMKGIVNPPDVSRGGNMKSILGFMNVLMPYIIITRPKLSLPDNFEKIYGYTCNMNLNLGQLSGYTQVEEVHLSGITGATEQEINEIEEELKKGVIF